MTGWPHALRLELLRSLYRGIEIAVVDPEDEYARLAAAVGTRWPAGELGDALILGERAKFAVLVGFGPDLCGGCACHASNVALAG